MKSILNKLGYALIAFILCSYGAGCTSANPVDHPENVVVVVNGSVITAQEFQDENLKREISAKILQKMMQLDSSIKAPTTGFLGALGLNESQLSSDQKQYINRLERNYPDKPINQNTIFNSLIRQEVLYQEAIKNGYVLSNKQAQERLQQINEASEQSIASDPTSQLLKVETELIFKEYGFNSQDDYLKWNLDNAAQTMAIKLMQNKFDETMAAHISDLSGGITLLMMQNNAWEDYTEFLLKTSQIDIKQGDYVVEYYGKPWEMGRLDLKG